MPPAVDRDLLNGWKEIAAWLGRSVRSVQRWERELRLPVHRIRAVEGQTVYARRSELEAWRASVDAALRSDDARDDEAEDEPAARAPGAPWGTAHTEPARATFAWRRVAAVLALAAALTGGALVARYWPAPATISKYELAGRHLKAIASDGRVLWAHDFGFGVRTAQFGIEPLPFDLDGDGRDEVLATVRRAVNRGTGEPLVDDVLYCFRPSGEVCWTLSGQRTFSCGDWTYAPPWQITALTVGDPDRRRAWVAFSHHTWWPSFVLEVDGAGASRLLYVQTGWISSLARWRGATDTYLVAGGVLSTHDRASVSFVPLSGQPAMAPYEGEPARFACEGAPAGRPAQIVAMPTFDAQLAREAYPFTRELMPVGSSLKARYNSGDAQAVLEIRPDLALAHLGVSSIYWVEHRSLERQGKLEHPADQCPERSASRDVLVWSPTTKWRAVTVPDSNQLAARLSR